MQKSPPKESGIFHTLKGKVKKKGGSAWHNDPSIQSCRLAFTPTLFIGLTKHRKGLKHRKELTKTTKNLKSHHT